jgi:hypothetical protein
MLAAIAVFALLLGWQVDRARRQRVAVKRLDQLALEKRADYAYDYEVGSTFLARRFRGLWRDCFHSIECVWLERIGDDDIATIVGPLDGDLLSLERCRGLTDVGLRHLATTFPRLTAVAIVACPGVTDAGFCDLLESLPGLQCVDVSVCPQITDVALARLARLRRLRELHVIADRSCGPWLEALRDAKQLRTLNVYCPTFADAGIQQLRALKSLDRLYIYVEAAIDRQSLAAFEELRQVLRQCKTVELHPEFVFDPAQFDLHGPNAND